MALKIKELTIGEGRPKICVPITARKEEELLGQLKGIRAACFKEGEACADLLEWRADFWEGIEKEESRRTGAKLIRQAFPELPLLFTFRSRTEGGERELSTQAYEEICSWVLEEEQAELLDIELFTGKHIIQKLIKRKKGTAIVLSNHDFEKTPPKKELISRMEEMDRLGADILKMAVMPQKERDVLTLLEATLEMKQLTKKPVVTMSMGKMGLVSRICGSTFGSAITFGSAGRPSAPGQIEAGKLLEALQLFEM